MAKILAIGNAVLDIILSSKGFPAEDSENRAQSRCQQAGGNVSNMLYGLSQLGNETAICCTLANDTGSKVLKKAFTDRNISTLFIESVIQAETPTSFITLNTLNGSRTILHYRDCPEVSFDHFAKIEIEDFDWLHFEGRNMDALPGMLNIAKTFLTHQPISLEVEKDRPEIEDLFKSVNLIFFSHHYAKQKGFKDAESFLIDAKLNAPQANLICTWGDKGAWYLPAGGKTHHQPAQKNMNVVDTLGAGDTFNAGVIHALAKGDNLADAIKLGSDLAARKCQRKGLDSLLKPLHSERPLANIKHVTNAKALMVKTPKYPNDLILIKHENEIKAYDNNCPHQDVPLTEAYKIDINPFEKTMKCSVHEAFFSIEEGECVEGPCLNDMLLAVPITIDKDGNIFLADD